MWHSLAELWDILGYFEAEWVFCLQTSFKTSYDGNGKVYTEKVITKLQLAKKIMQADRKCVNEGSAYDGWRHSLN